MSEQEIDLPPSRLSIGHGDRLTRRLVLSAAGLAPDHATMDTVHAAFFDLMTRYGPPGLADRWHAAQLKPFALTPDPAADLGRTGVVPLREGAFRLDVIPLTTSAARAVDTALLGAVQDRATLQLGRTPFSLAALPTVARPAPPADLPPDGLIRLAFDTPVKYRTTDGWATDVPEPRLVFGETLRRWQRLVPPGDPGAPPADAEPAALTAAITLRGWRTMMAGVRMPSVRVDVPLHSGRRRGREPGLEVGFIGEATYAVDGPLETRRLAAAAAAFAAAAGLGSRTAYGLGRTRVLSGPGIGPDFDAVEPEGCARTALEMLATRKARRDAETGARGSRPNTWSGEMLATSATRVQTHHCGRVASVSGQELQCFGCVGPRCSRLLEQPPALVGRVQPALPLLVVLTDSCK